MKDKKINITIYKKCIMQNDKKFGVLVPEKGGGGGVVWERP